MKEYKRISRPKEQIVYNDPMYIRLQELEDKIERGELVENKVVAYVNMARSNSKHLIDKALKYDELKAKIENGTLIELPCKVGNTVYFVNTRPSPRIEEYVVYGIMLDGREIILHIDFMETIYAKNVYFTKAEAEAKLTELKGEV